MLRCKKIKMPTLFTQSYTHQNITNSSGLILPFYIGGQERGS